MKIQLPKAIAVIFLLVFTALNCYSLTINWLGTAANNNWSNTANWSSGTVPTSADDVQIGVTAFTNQPTVNNSYVCKSLTFGILKNVILTVKTGLTLTVNQNIQQNFGTGTAGTANSAAGTVTSSYSTTLTGLGTIICSGNFIIGNTTAPANYSANAYDISSQVSQLTINGNLVLNSVGNGSTTANNINYPAFSLDNNTVTLYGQIVTSTTGSPTNNYYANRSTDANATYFKGIGLFSANNPIIFSTGTTNTNATTLELVNNAAISNFTTNLFVGFDYEGTGGGTVLYDSPTGTQTIYTDNDGLATIDDTYNNLTLSGASTKVTDGGPLQVGNATSGGGNLNTGGGNVDLRTNATKLTVNNNWVNASTVLAGSKLLTVGNNLTNSGTLSGSTGALAVGAAFKNTGSFTGGGGAVGVQTNINNTGTYVQGNGALVVGNNLANSGSVTLGSGTTTIGNNLNNSGPITEGTGNVTVGNILNNYLQGTVTGSSTTAANTVVTGDANNYGILNLLNENLEFDSDYTNFSGGTFTAGTGLVYFNGVTQTLLDNSTGTLFNRVTFYTHATISAGIGNFSVSPTGVLTMKALSTFYGSLVAGNTVTNPAKTDAYLTLMSASASTATVAAIPANCKITGNVNVQRLITGGSSQYRGYRILSSPVSVTTNSGTSSGYFSINHLKNSAYITGTTGSGGGFDSPSANNPTLYLYRENLVPSNTSFISGNFRGINNLTSAPLYALDGETGNFNIFSGEGVIFFFRGDRNAAAIAAETTPFYTPTSTLLTTTGLLNQQGITVKSWYTPTLSTLGYTTTSGAANVKGMNLVGNPYASSIDWDTYSTSAAAAGVYAPLVSGATGISKFIYVLDSKSKNYNVYMAGGSGVGTLVSSGSNIIASGQGFFVQASTGGASLTFNEAAKINTQPTAANGNLFLGTPVADAVSRYMHITMAKDSIHIDGIVIRFDADAKAGYVFNEDAPYRSGNGPVSLASDAADGTHLAINSLPLIKKEQVIALNVNAASTGIYQLVTDNIRSLPAIYEVWLKDAYTKDSLDVRHYRNYTFNLIRSDTNSYGSKRFSLVIRQNPALKLHLLSFAAAKITKGAQVIWSVENEQNYTNFTVERSVDNGITFTVLGGLLSNAQGTYSFTDLSPVNASDKYRLKLEDLNGDISYSGIVTLMYGSLAGTHAGISVYPNPSTGTINMAVINDSTAQTAALVATATSVSAYTIKIMNMNGAVVQTASSASRSWQANVGKLTPGNYVIQVTNNSSNKLVGKSTFVKL